jgi:hypothetical protein
LHTVARQVFKCESSQLAGLGRGKTARPLDKPPAARTTTVKITEKTGETTSVKTIEKIDVKTTSVKTGPRDPLVRKQLHYLDLPPSNLAKQVTPPVLTLFTKPKKPCRPLSDPSMTIISRKKTSRMSSTLFSMLIYLGADSTSTTSCPTSTLTSTMTSPTGEMPPKSFSTMFHPADDDQGMKKNHLRKN